MATLYFSKVNINSNIFEVYKEPGKYEEIINNLFAKINQETKVIDEENKIYKFCDINKNSDKMYIVGRLVKIFEGENISYDEEKDTINTVSADDLASYITFYFDMKNEIVAFITRNDFGYRQFMEKFTLLLNESVKDVEFELFLEKNIEVFKEKISKFKQILSVDLVIVPPNPNREEFDTLFGLTSEEFEETNATKYKQTISTSSKNEVGINPQGSFFEKAYYGIANGFGEMKVSGKNHSDVKYYITSDEDAPFTRPITEVEKESLSAFPEISNKFILELLSQKLRFNRNEKQD